MAALQTAPVPATATKPPPSSLSPTKDSKPSSPISSILKPDAPDAALSLGNKPESPKGAKSSSPPSDVSKPKDAPTAAVPEPDRIVPKGKSKDVDDDTPTVPAIPATIDMDIFNQILELDADDPTLDFSSSMVGAYFGQAVSTFKQMEDALASKDLNKLSELGHFLKGSSAQLGVTRVQVSCEKIQHYGHLRDNEKDLDLTAIEALSRISNLMSTVKIEYSTAESWLRNYFRQRDVEVAVEEFD